MLSFRTWLLFLVFWHAVSAIAQTPAFVKPAVSSGLIIPYPSLRTKNVPSRPVVVWMPKGYVNTERYPVVYMLDGQELFQNSGTDFQDDWQLDETVQQLINSGKIPGCIVVGIYSTNKDRLSEYFPKSIYEALPTSAKDEIAKQGAFDFIKSDSMLRFIVNEVKPFIDIKYPTRNGTANTFLVGKGFGGMLATYALCKYPYIFGGVASLSVNSLSETSNSFSQATNIQVLDQFSLYLGSQLPQPPAGKIYFDIDNRIANYPPSTLSKKLDSLMRKMGYTAENEKTSDVPIDSQQQVDWPKRVSDIFTFLLTPQVAKAGEK